jgi:hypothetical protein
MAAAAAGRDKRTMSEVPIQAVRRAYPALAKDILAPLLAFMDEAERAFAGDLEKFHILLAVALRTAEHPDIAAVAARAERGEEVELPSLWTNVHSIGLSIGVPEETVRRKVAALVRTGWLERQDHSVRYTLKGARELDALRACILKLAIANHRAVERALEPPSPPPRPRTGEAAARGALRGRTSRAARRRGPGPGPRRRRAGSEIQDRACAGVVS